MFMQLDQQKELKDKKNKLKIVNIWLNKFKKILMYFEPH